MIPVMAQQDAMKLTVRIVRSLPVTISYRDAGDIRDRFNEVAFLITKGFGEVFGDYIGFRRVVCSEKGTFEKNYRERSFIEAISDRIVFV